MKLKVFVLLFFVSFLFNTKLFCVKNNDIEMTIFVHGTFAIRETVSFSTFFKLLKDEIDDTSYKKNVEKLRKEPYYFNLQPIDFIGLKEIKRNKIYKGPEIFAELYNNLYKKLYKCKNNCHYYTYGWSGLLSAKSRLQESFEFYKILKKEIEKIKLKYGKEPKIRLIGHSHGGNICLNLAFAREENLKDKFKINELILVGMPVQKCTEALIQKPIFERVYHIFSSGDYVQKMDIFAPYNFFSKNKFNENLNFKLPEKLTQIEISINIPIKSRPPRIANKSPGHVELWFFGWTPAMYRKKHPFYPLPIGIFIPYLTYISENYLKEEKYFKCLIQPEHQQVKIKGKTKNSREKIPFISKKDLESFKEFALKKYNTRKILKIPKV